MTVLARNPSAAAVNSSTGDAWANLAEIIHDDLSPVTVSMGDHNDETQYLEVTNFGYTTGEIPDTDTIEGIKVTVKRIMYSSGGDLVIRDTEVKIIKGGTIGSENKGELTTDWSTSIENNDYGGATDLWSETWIPSDIRASNFGVAIRCKAFSPTSSSAGYVCAGIDVVTMTVYTNAGDVTVTFQVDTAAEFAITPTIATGPVSLIQSDADFIINPTVVPVAMSVTLEGTDVTTKIIPDSLDILKLLRKDRGDICRFIIKQVDASYQVDGGQLIIVKMTGQGPPVFVGHVVETRPLKYSAGAWLYQVEARSGENIFFRKNIHDIVRDETIESAVNKVLQNPKHSWPSNLYTTVTNTDGVMDLTIDYYAFRGAFAYQIFDLFAEITDSAWRLNWNSVDERFELEFYDPTNKYDGFELSSTSETFKWSTFVPEINLNDLINRQTVKGGKEISDSDTVAYFRGDDLTSKFDLPTKPFSDDTNIILNDNFDQNSLNESIWTEYDEPGNFFYVDQSGFAQFEPAVGNQQPVGIVSKVFSKRAKEPILIVDITWVSDGEAVFGFTEQTDIDPDADLNMREHLVAGFYVNGSGDVSWVEDGIATSVSPALSLSADTQYRFFIKLKSGGGALFQHQSDTDSYTRTWTEDADTSSSTASILSAVVASKDAGFTLANVKMRNPYLAVKLEVDRGSGFVEEFVGFGDSDQDMDAVIVNEQVIAFFGSNPGPSTVPEAPDFNRDITSVDTGTDLLTISGGHKLDDGAQITFSTDGTLPTGVIADIPYYINGSSATEFSIHPTRQDGIDDTNAVDITGSGSGTHTIRPGADYKNIKVTYREAKEIIVRYEDADSIAEVAGLFSSNDDGVREAPVIIDKTIASTEIAWQRGKSIVANKKHLIKKINFESQWQILKDSGLLKIPQPGDTVQVSITIPTTNRVISKLMPLNSITMQATRNGNDMHLQMELSFFEVGVFRVFQELLERGELISLSEAEAITNFKSVSDTLTLSESATPKQNLTGYWGDSRFDRQITSIDTGTDVITLDSNHDFTTEDPVIVTTTGTAPAGTAIETRYFVRSVSANTVSLHPTAADATADTNTIDITDSGSGTHYVKLDGWYWNMHLWGSFS